jgi:hypothetical protein
MKTQSPLKREKLWSTVLILVLGVFLTSCSESTPKKNNQGSSNSTVGTGETQNNPNVGPTGNPDPINDDTVNGNDDVTYYDEEDPDDSVPLPGTPYESCGQVYRQFNNPIIFFVSESNQTLQLQEFSYDSVPFIRNIKFGSDSFTACIDGYRNGMNLFVNTVTNKVAVNHPLKLYQNNEYTHELCGNIAYVTNFSGVTTLNLKVSNVYYLLEAMYPNMFTFPGGIPSLTSSITSANAPEACIYSSKASFYDYGESFKPQFEVEAIDMGALNP